ncbi:MAG: ArsR family transcriptional regulator [Anaerolineae bacterium]|nr:MAG: ArsR family transcriptional regulator [Anaerolineae bacterium]
MPSTRQRILDLLAERHTASAPELSRMLGVTEANVRHHLGVLARAGQVEVVGETPTGGRGRPRQRYMLTPRAQTHGLDLLSAALLDELGRGSKQETSLRKLADQLAAQDETPHGPPTARLNAAVERLNDLRYEAHWEAHSEGPQVILGRCPYAAIIDDHPELCRMDAHLLQNLIGEDVEQTAKFARRPEGPAVCVFAVGK